MTRLAQFASLPLVHALGWTLLHFCWEGALVALLLACALNVIPLRRSRLRYAAACAALFCVAASPLVTFTVLARDETPRQIVVAIPDDAPAIASIVAGRAQAAEPWSGRFETALNQCLPMVVAAWLAGVVIFLCRLNLGLVAIARWRSMGVAPAEAELQEMLRALRIRIGMERAVALLNSARVLSPTVVGWLRPAILLPLGCMTGLSQAQIEAIFAHELAHIRRHDYLVNLVQSVVETLLFYHPAVWWISTRVRHEREHCCDDFAVAITGDRLSYASALSHLEERRGRWRPSDALAASGGVLKMRIARLLGLNQAPAFPRAAAVLMLGAALASAGLIVRGVARAQSGPSTEQAASKVIFDAKGGAYKTWLNQDVRWIITPQERTMFLTLSNDEERNEFIQQFWERRNPNPGNRDNIFREEHYRRIAFANEHFAAGGQPGWESDRGHVYIVFGPADSIDAHGADAGTTDKPFQIWHYRSIRIQRPPVKNPDGSGYTAQPEVKKDYDFRFVDECDCGRYELKSQWPSTSEIGKSNSVRSSSAVAQNGSASSGARIQVSKLIIVSDDLPKFEERQIVQEYQGRTYPLQELTERIRQHLRDRGYARAAVGILHAPTAPSNAAPQSAEISVRVSAGPQYKLSRFVVEGANALSMYEIVQQFPLHPGELFSATAVGKGLIQLKQLYRTHGYANFAAIPRLQFDDGRRTVALILEIQEGHAS